MWVYQKIQDEPGCYLYTVGFFAPNGTWHTDSDHATREEAAARVSCLNGQIPADVMEESFSLPQWDR